MRPWGVHFRPKADIRSARGELLAGSGVATLQASRAASGRGIQMTPYWQRLDDSSSLQDEIDNILRQFDVRPVGSGYIDVIAPLDKAQRLLDELSRLGIAVRVVTLWCEASEGNKQRYGCPHGMGGPVHGGIW